MYIKLKSKITKHLKSIFLISLFFFPMQAFAFKVGPKLSTLGYGVEAELYDFGVVSLRANANYLSLKKDGNDKAVDYNYTCKLRTTGIYANYKPFLGSLFLTGGLVLNKNYFSASGTPSSNVTINNRTYTPQQMGTISGKIKFRPISPYVGLGYSADLKAAQINFELGVLMQTGPKANLSATGLLAQNSQMIDDLESDIQSAVKNTGIFKYYPTLGISVLF